MAFWEGSFWQGNFWVSGFWEGLGAVKYLQGETSFVPQTTASVDVQPAVTARPNFMAAISGPVDITPPLKGSAGIVPLDDGKVS